MVANNLNGGFLSQEQLSDLSFAQIGDDVFISENAVIVGCENIKLGNNVRIDPFSVIVANEGFLYLGEYTHIAGGCHLSCVGGIVIQDFGVLAHGVKLYSGSDVYDGSGLTHPLIAREFKNLEIGQITLEKHVIIGANSVVLPGCSIRIGTSVGAHSLVKKDLNEWSLYAGVPAKKIGERSKQLLELEDKHYLSIG